MKKKIASSSTLSAALALFAMLFGSGNIVYPLSLGRDTGSVAIYAMVGFFLTAVFVPLFGIISIALFDGDYKAFLGRIGKVPSAFLIFLCMALIGPLCIIPRSIAISHAALQWCVPALSMLQFSIFAAALLFVCTVRQSKVLDLLGRFLGPIKLALLTFIIIKGFFVAAQAPVCQLTILSAFSRGLLEGYGTLDLLAAIFFSSLILAGFKKGLVGEITAQEHKKILALACKSGALAALLLGLVYAGFVMVSAWHAVACAGVDQGQLLSTLASILLGTAGGVLASVTLAVACLTTAIALTTVFANYVTAELFDNKISYTVALLLTLGIAVVFANLGFSGIMAAVLPVIVIAYPALIVLSVTNMIYKLAQIDLGVAPFYVTLVISCIIKTWC